MQRSGKETSASDHPGIRSSRHMHLIILVIIPALTVIHLIIDHPALIII